MPFFPGTKLGPYEILSPAGAGGMGEVYRARDTRLDRTVAIKVLPSHLSSRPDWPDLRQRFEREAKAISSLNHPHICTLHDIGHQEGTDYLVLEYLEGETLAKRLEKGPLPTEQVLRHGIEIADALDKAHRQGLIHRDLKPGNVMLTKSGVKLLDFGLAKAAAGVGAGLVPLQEMVTEGKPLTAEGMLVGTLQYMAPEQLEGKEADARTDLFALGAVLYEMATSRPAFAGKSAASLIAAILGSDPPSILKLQPMAPPALDRVVKTCLAKDPDERWQKAHDVVLELKWIAEAGSQAGVPTPVVARRKSRERLGWIVAGVLLVPLLAALTVAVVHLREAPEKTRAIRFSLALPEKMTFRLLDLPVVSPDGQRVVFTGAIPNGKDLLWIRALDSLTAQTLPGTEGAYLPFWSSDSRYVAFFTFEKLKKVEASGGPPLTLCDAPGPFQQGGTWNPEGVILFVPGPESPVFRVSSAGGEAKPVTALDPSRKETSHRWPYFLPDGHHFLYLALSSRPDKEGIYVASLDSKDTQRLLIAGSNAAYAPPGYLLFMRQETLMAQPFDAKKLQSTGDSFPIVEQVAWMVFSQGAAFSVSRNGVLAYRTGGVEKTQLVWFDRGGKQLGALGEPADYSNPSLSLDEKKVAVGRRDPQTKTRDLWLFDLKRGTTSRFTFDPSDDLNPAWSPDGSRIAFTSDRKGHRDIYQKIASGTGEDELLLESNGDKNVEDWSPDGRFLLYSGPGPQGRDNLWMLPFSGDRKPTLFQRSPFNEDQAQISPDGRWLAYRSDESGQDEVYVQPFPASGGKWQISSGGGIEPRWRHDGKELFYIAGQKLMAVEVKAGSPTFEAGVPEVLFEAPFASFIPRNRYMVAANGQRFLINITTVETGSSQITVVVNWTADLKK